jgi:hypothetical protein
MSKPVINSFIKRFTQSGLTTKITPWMVEGYQPSRSLSGIDGYASDKQIEVRYVGCKPDESWDMVLSPADNLLCKFYILDKKDYLIVYFANKTPFIELWHKPLLASDSWESVMGKIKQRLKKEAAESVSGGSVGSLFAKIERFSKK